MLQDLDAVHLEDKWDFGWYVQRKINIVKQWYIDARMSQEEKAEQADLRESFKQQQEERRAALLEQEYNTFVSHR